ncbi:hypothetical protein PR048_005199 [Dryococelus australis]|uniref:Uncharacterized protein n=1 Tax=Dryococelus australis TaxID=614101 RepID=A0ABQ9I7I3_9NEOP|nr:hypothetical protein PR048_005199 [Dryococelus australis]
MTGSCDITGRFEEGKQRLTIIQLLLSSGGEMNSSCMHISNFKKKTQPVSSRENLWRLQLTQESYNILEDETQNSVDNPEFTSPIAHSNVCKTKARSFEIATEIRDNK